MNAFYQNRLYSYWLPVYIKMIKNMGFPAHWHTDIELLWVIEGSIQVGFNQDLRVLHAGDLAVITSGNIHYYDYADTDSKTLNLIFNSHIIGHNDGWPSENYTLHPFIEKTSLTLPEQINAMEQISHCLFSILDEYTQSNSFCNYVITGNLYQLCGLLLRYFSDKNTQALPINKGLPSSNHLVKMYAILAFIDSNYTTNITLPEIATKFNLSISNFTKLFKTTIGMNLSDYVLHKRIEKAEFLLKEGKKLISEIAFDCGFESIRTFNRVFKSNRGLSPSIYCKKYKEYLQK